MSKELSEKEELIRFEEKLRGMIAEYRQEKKSRGGKPVPPTFNFQKPVKAIAEEKQEITAAPPPSSPFASMSNEEKLAFLVKNKVKHDVFESEPDSATLILQSRDGENTICRLNNEDMAFYNQLKTQANTPVNNPTGPRPKQ